MTIAPPAAAENNAVTETVAALLERRTGQQISPSRTWRIEAALKPILRELAIDDMNELARRLGTAGDPALSDRVVDALLNHETSFFRDAAVLDNVADALVALRAEVGTRRLRIWSVGCSSGQEPLSLAILLHERGLDASAVEIVATDVSPGVTARARAARFSQFEVQRGLSIRRMMTWFDGDDGEWAARRELVRRVQFRQQNLVVDAPPPGRFDLILCRNVLLYFSPEMRRAAFARLAPAARPGGLLVLGAGETVTDQTDLFAAAEEWRGMYRRTDIAA